MLTATLLTLALHASPRLLYEQKCLYCHSEEVTEVTRRTPAQWKKLVSRMRAKAPVLITRSDVRVLTEYLVKTLKLVPPASRPTPVATDTPNPTPTPTPAPEPEPPPAAPEEPEEPLPPPPVIAAEERVDEEGAELMQRRCSKCHTLVRVFGKLDSYERALFTLKRMRLKTGSGISRDDYERLEAFLKAQFNIQ
ncbi:MAG: photosystem P840 reaction-center cytochrome c-551 [Archangiaceae bacterium]|nr:photosystem P840 reaction-center cytochrome c-551 [Archangiaceae bacterium]